MTAPSSTQGSSGRLAALAAAGSLVAAPILLFFPILLDRVPAMRDFPRWVWPGRFLWRSAVLQGRLPEWNPFVGLGAPMPAAPVHGTFYPGHLLLLGPLPATMAVAVTWLLHAIVAGLGGYALARRLGCRRSVAVAAGLIWEIGGYAVSMWGDGEKVLSGAWIPWAALGLASLIASSDRLGRPLVGAAAAFAMIALAGDPFLWAHAAALGLAVGWALAAEQRGAATAARQAAQRGAAVLGLAALLAAVALIPAALLMSDTERAGGLGRELAEHWSLAPGRIAALFAPFSGAGENEWAPSLYLGATVLVLAVLAGHSRVAVVLWCATALAVLAALGSHTPIHAGLRWMLPPLRWMRYPEKHVLIAVGALGLLAALGVERVLRAPRVDGRTELRTAAIPLTALAGLALLLALQGRLASDLPRVAVPCLLLAALLRVLRTSPRLSALLPLLVFLDLFAAAESRVSWADGKALRTPTEPLRTAASPGAPPPRLYTSPDVGGRLAMLPQNVVVPWGLAHVPGHESMQSSRTHQLWDALSRQGTRALDVMDIQWLVLPPGGWPAGSSPVAGLDGGLLLRRPSPGRLTLHGRVQVVDDAAALALIARGERSPRDVALVAPGPAAHPLHGAGDGTCRSASHAPERIEIACHVLAPEVLLAVSEAASRGWQVAVDGHPDEIVRVNVAMRGVYLKTGDHVVTMTFRTPGLVPGAALSALGLGLAIVLVLRSRRRGDVAAAATPPVSG